MITPQEKSLLGLAFSKVVSHGGAKQRIVESAGDALKVEFTEASMGSLDSGLFAANALAKAGLLKDPIDTSDKTQLFPPSAGKPMALAKNLVMAHDGRKLSLTFTPVEEIPAQQIHGMLEMAELQAKAASYSRAGLSR